MRHHEPDEGVVDGPAKQYGSAFARGLAFRLVRLLVYRLVGVVRPGWRNALPLVRLRDCYADHGTAAPAVYGDPRFDANLRAIEAEIRRLKRGAPPRPVSLPHDFPPGAKETLL